MVAVRVHGLDEGGDHVVGRFGPAPFDELLGVVEQAQGAGGEVAVDVGVFVHPLPYLRLIGFVDADEFADDGAGQRGGVLAEEVAGALLGEGLDELGGDVLDARPQGLDAPDGERGCHEAAQPAVVLAVLEHQVGREVAHQLVRHVEGREGLVRDAGSFLARHVADVGDEPRVAPGGLELLASGDQPDRRPAGEPDADEGCLLPQAREGADGVVLEFGGQQADDGFGHGRRLLDVLV